MQDQYEDNYWPEDAIFMERNSRDFRSRIARINGNAEAVCETLHKSPTGEYITSPVLGFPLTLRCSQGGLLPTL